MHPPLFQPHPLCESEVKALVTCHEERSIAKFWGACNDAKHALDMCFRVRVARSACAPYAIFCAALTTAHAPTPHPHALALTGGEEAASEAEQENYGAAEAEMMCCTVLVDRGVHLRLAALYSRCACGCVSLHPTSF